MVENQDVGEVAVVVINDHFVVLEDLAQVLENVVFQYSLHILTNFVNESGILLSLDLINVPVKLKGLSDLS